MTDIHTCEDTCVEHWHEHELVCPYCLHETSDSSEILRHNNYSGTTECDDCGREYRYGTTVDYEDGGVSSIVYSTYQKDLS